MRRLKNFSLPPLEEPKIAREIARFGNKTGYLDEKFFRVLTCSDLFHFDTQLSTLTYQDCDIPYLGICFSGAD